MRDVYVEWMIKRKRSLGDNLMRALSIGVLVGSAVLFAISGNVAIMLVTLAAAGFGYFAFTYTDVEYEYVYVTGELGIDRILSKSKRKRVETVETARIEIIAPLGSHKLDAYKNKKYREFDYSAGVKSEHSHVFVIYCNSGRKLLFEPNREMMQALRDELPHKVHLEP